MEGTPLPDSLLHNGLVDVTIHVGDVVSLARLGCIHWQVRAHEKLALKQLDTNHSEHEDEEDGDGHDVANGLDWHDHTLHNLLETWGTVDSTEGTEDAENTENLEETYPRSAEDANEGDSNNYYIKAVEGRTGHGAFVEKEPVRDELEETLSGEDGGEKVVKIS